MAEMTFDKAINVATTMANHFRAFSQLKEVIEFAISLEQSKKESLDMIEEHKRTIKNLETRKEKLAKEVFLKETENAAILEARKKAIAIDVELRDSIEKHKARMQKLDEEYVEKGNEYDTKKQEKINYLKEIEDVIAGKEQRLAVLKEYVEKRAKEIETTLTG